MTQGSRPFFRKSERRMRSWGWELTAKENSNANEWDKDKQG